MTVSVVASASVGNTNNTDATSVVCSKPAGTASGDFMVAIFTAPYTGSLTYTPPAGWTLVNSSAGGGGVSLWSGLYTKTAGGSEPSSYTFGCSAAGSMTVGIVTYRGTDGTFSSASGGNPRVNTGTTTNPQTISPLASIVGTGLATFACSWHDAGGSGDTSGGSASQASTEQWDLARTDGSPSTHERGSSCYTLNAEYTNGSNNPTSATITLSGAPTSYVNWTWGLNSVASGTAASTMGGFTSSLSGNVVANPSGTIGSTMGAFTSSLAGQEIPGGAIASTMGAFGSSLAGAVSGVKIEFLINGVWTDVTQWVRYSSGVDITRGRSASGSTMTTSVAHFTLDNRPDTADSRFSLRNANGPYYGYIGRNIQCRITKQEAGYRFWGEVSSWMPSADTTNSDRYVQIEASGITRRMGATTAPTLPAMYREVMSASPAPLGYWPCDETAGALAFSSPIADVPNIRITGSPTFGSYTSLVSAPSIPEVNNARYSLPIMPTANLQTGITVAFVIASPGGITNDTEICTISAMRDDGSPTQVTLSYTGTNEFTIDSVPMGSTTGMTVPIVGESGLVLYFGYRMNGTNSRFSLFYQGEDDATPILAGSSGVDAFTNLGGSIGVTFNDARAALSDASAAYIGHVAVWDGFAETDPDNLPHQYASVGAYAKEPAGTRFARLCTEEGITSVVNNDSNSSKMGQQTQKSILALLQECEATDMGIMYELRDDFGLGYIVRRDLYNKATDLELDYESDLTSQLQPTFDDKGVENDVTVQRDGGSSARYVVDSNSALSTQDPPNGVGRYQSSTTVSLGSDNQCYPQAGWRAHLGTVDEERITSVGITVQSESFRDDSTLTADAYAVDSGSRMVITNAPDWASDSVDQIVQGYSERFDNDIHSIAFNTDSASPYDTAVVAVTPTSTSAKADSLTSTLASDITSTATSLSVAVTGVLWTVNASADFDIIVDGEVMNVTAVSGTSSPQTFTVTRSVNSVVKSHSSTDQVKLYNPAIVGL